MRSRNRNCEPVTKAEADSRPVESLSGSVLSNVLLGISRYTRYGSGDC